MPNKRDDFLKLVGGSCFTQDPGEKQRSHEHSLIRTLLSTSGADPAAIAKWSREANGELSFSWLLEKFPDFPFACGVCRVDKLTTADLLDKFNASKIKTDWIDLCNVWPTSKYYALFISSHGSGWGELVLHNLDHWLLPESSWRIQRRVRTHTLLIEPAKGFLKLLAKEYHVWME